MNTVINQVINNRVHTNLRGLFRHFPVYSSEAFFAFLLMTISP